MQSLERMIFIDITDVLNTARISKRSTNLSIFRRAPSIDLENTRRYSTLSNHVPARLADRERADSQINKNKQIAGYEKHTKDIGSFTS